MTNLRMCKDFINLLGHHILDLPDTSILPVLYNVDSFLQIQPMLIQWNEAAP